MIGTRYTMERLDNNGPYTKENCIWASVKTQANNRRNTITAEYRGKTQALSKWAEELGIKRGVLYGRLRLGWTVEQAFRKD